LEAWRQGMVMLPLMREDIQKAINP